MARTARLEIEIDSRKAASGANTAERELAALRRGARDTVEQMRRASAGNDHYGRSAVNASRDVDRLTRSNQRSHEGFLKTNVSANGLATSFVALRNAAIVLGAIGLAHKFLEITDSFKKMDAQIRLSIPSTQSFAQAQDDVRRIAFATRTGLEATTELYAKVARSSQDLGKSTAEAAIFTETFTKTLKIGGASVAEADAVTRQFGQALASGVLRGDEFNSVMEGSPRLARLLADSLGVPIGALRQMAADGKLTADKLYSALTDRRFTAKIDEEFKQMPVTFAEATQRLKDQAGIVFSAFDRGGEFSQAITNFMLGGVDDMNTLEKRAENLGIEIRSAFAGLGDVFQPFVDGAHEAFANVGIDFANFSGDGRKQISDLLGVLDGIRNIPHNINRSIEDAVNSTGLGGVILKDPNKYRNEKPYDSQGTFDRGYVAKKNELKDEQYERTTKNFFGPAANFAGNPNAALDYVNGIGAFAVKPKPKPAPDADNGTGSKSRSKEQVLTDFIRELNKRGITTLANPIRTAEQQNGLFKQGLTPLSGYGAGNISAHQDARALDLTRGSFDPATKDKINAAAQAAGIKGLEFIKESGNRRHLEFTGNGKPGDVSSELAEQKRLQDEIERKEKERARRQVEFAAQLQQDADLATVLPQQAEAYNAKLELRRIINDGNLAGTKEITAEQSKQIDQLIALKNQNAFIRDITVDLQDAGFEKLRLEERGNIISKSTADTEADNLAIQERLWPYKLRAMQQGLDLQDPINKAALEELEIRERQNFALEKKNRLIQQGIDVGAQYGGILGQQGADRQRIGDDRKALEAAREAGRLEAGVYEAATKGLDNAIYEVNNRFRFEFIDSIDFLANQFGGKFGAAIQGFANVLNQVSAQSRGDFSKSGVAGGIIGLFNGPKGNPVADAAQKASQSTLNQLTSGSTYKNPLASLASGFGSFKGDLKNLFGKGGDFTKGLGSVLGKAGVGSTIGSATSGLMDLLGIKNSKFGAQAGGAIGGVVGGPIGAIAGSIIGGVVGGFFKKTPSGSASVSNSGIDAKGTTGAITDDLKASAGNLQATIQKIADSLGASVGKYDVGFGRYKDYYQVSSVGNDPRLGKTYFDKKSSNALYDGKDPVAAMTAAVLAAIADGAIKGLSPTLERALRNAGSNIDKGIADALKLKSVFDELKAINDPVNFALETLNKGFTEIADLLRSAGGTAEEFAQAEQLYQIKRKQIIEEGNAGSLKQMKDYLFSLTGGTSSVLSPESRLATSRSELDRLDALRASGGKVDFGQYQSTADAFLAASRDAKGSTTGFFADLARVTSTVSGLIDAEKAKVATTPPIDFTPVVASLDYQTAVLAGLLADIRDGTYSTTLNAASASQSVRLSDARYMNLSNA